MIAWITIWLALSSVVSEAKDNVNNEVFQLVWNTLISTNSKYMIEWKIKFYDCRVVNWYRVYLSEKKDIIWSSNFDIIDDKKIQEVKSSPQCKIMWILRQKSL